MRPLLSVALTSFVCLIALSDDAYAARVKCPVCGQTFPQDRLICPNDGTNLELLGKRIPDRDSESDGEVTDEEEPPPAEDASGSKYRRHDRGGERKVTPRSSVDTYSDRRDRLAGDRRVGPSESEAGQPSDKSREEHLKEEAMRAEQFRRQRETAWSLRREETESSKSQRQELLARREELLSSLAAPLTSLGTRLWWMPEGGDAGTVVAAEIDINFVRDVLRLGLSSSLGVRFLSNRGDIVFLETLSVGAQLPWRYSPYLTMRVGLGGLSSQRAGEDRVNPLGIWGGEAGVDVWINPWLCLSPSLGYAFLLDREDKWHTFTAKLSVGF